MRRVLPQGIVNPVVVVVVHVLTNQTAEMLFLERDDMVQDFPAAASNPALGDSILPRRPNARPLRLQARGRQETDHFGIEFGIAVQDQVAIRAYLGKRFAQLLDYPCRTRMRCDVEVLGYVAASVL